MNILAINGSPRGAKGNTEQLLISFLQGACDAGATVETLYLKDKRIEHCAGCFTCWTKTPGVCIHKDDMPALLDELRAADLVVFATPLYVYTVSGLMKDFMDRMIPLAQPFIVWQGEHFGHPARYPDQKALKVVLISNCGFPEAHHFSGLVETFRHLSQSADVICCAGGELLRQSALRDSLTWYLEATRQAGQEVVEQGHISRETQAILDRPLAQDPAVYANMANAWWQSQGVNMIEQTEDTPTSTATPLAPPCAPVAGRDLTMRDLIAGMALGFNPQAAGDLRAVIQFEVSGEQPGHYYLDMAQGKCAAFAGTHVQPTLTIHTPAPVWMVISRGELNGATALMEGKYTIQGDLGLLMRFNRLFAARV